MYSNIMELPSQVTASLADDDATEWMARYNECIRSVEDPTEDDVLAARRSAWYHVRDRPSSYSFCARATVEAVDKQKELITLKSIRDNMRDYVLHGGPMSWDHSSYIIGTVWGWDDVDTPHGPGIEVWGNLYGGDQYIYDQTRKRFGKGATKLSVSGPATKVPTCDMDHGCYVRREMEQLMEIALTPHPVNEYATLTWSSDALGDVRKSADAWLSVFDVEIHRSEDQCPILQLRKSLREIGADAHARDGGVFIPMTDTADSIRRARDAGLYATPCKDGRLGDGIMIAEPNALLEREFKYSVAKGESGPDGTLLLHMVGRDRFTDLYNKGLLVRDGGRYAFRAPF